MHVILILLPVFVRVSFATEPLHKAAETGAKAAPQSKEEYVPDPRLLENAGEMVKSDRPAEAIELLSSYRPSREEMFAYHYSYAQALVQLKRPYESIEHYRLAYVYAGSEADKERLLFERAEVYAGMNYHSEAVVCFDVFLKQFPKSGFVEQAQLGIAEAHFRIGEYRDALAHYEKSGNTLRARYGKANALQSLGRTAEAHEIYKDLIANDPQVINASSLTLLNIGENYRLSGKPGDAKVYLASVKDAPYLYRAAMGLGLIALEEEKLDEAERYFSTAAGSLERSVRAEAIMNRAEAHTRSGKYDEAEAALQQVRKEYPYGKQYDAAVLLLAKVFRTRGKFKDEVALLQTMIYRRTPSRAALDELEDVMLAARTEDHASFEQLWKGSGRWLLDPSRTQSLLTIARGLRHSGKPFLDLCAWLIRYGPDEAKSEARLLLADFHVEMGDADTAWGYLKRARIKKQSDEVLRIRAKVYLRKNDPVKASQELMAIRTLKESDLSLLLDASPPARSKDNDKGLQFCMQSLKQIQASASLLVRLADTLAAAGRTRDALRIYQDAVTAGKTAVAAVASADVAWAHYRIATLGSGEERAQSLKELQTDKSAVGRLAAADLKSRALKEKMGQVSQ